MPYIKQEQRDRLDLTIDNLVDLLDGGKNVDTVDGELNYIVTRLLKSLYPQRYFHFNRAMGVLACIQAEFYRKVVADYENLKEAENGLVE